jgi:hypothetical protein
MKTGIHAFTILIIVLASFYSFGQTKYTVRDGVTLEPMPFVKVIPDTGAPSFTDIDGRFLLSSEITQFQLKFSTYKDTLIEVAKLDTNVIFMWSSLQEIVEVTVVAGENPAHRIIDLVIENRKKNHPLSNDAFTYNSYSKFIFDANDGLKDRVMDAPPEDSLAEGLKFLNEQHLFMLESASERKFIPPAKDRENITAYKVSGLSLPIFSTFAQSLQSFNFYDNEFQLLGATYINPIAEGGTRRYLFILQDTTVIGNDTTFTITYRPRINKNFKGMEGTMYINTNGYAIEKVIASPYSRDTAVTFKAKIIQDYHLIDGYKWFPYNLSTQVELHGLGITVGDEAGFITGKGNTYIKDVVLNPDDLKKRGFGNISIATDPDAKDADDEVWDAYRGEELTDKEKKTYQVIDSLGKATNLDRKLTALMALSTGKIRINKINLLLGKFIDYNFYEDLRLGAGIETSELLMKNIAIGGYFGWGTRDKDWKYGGYTTFHINKRKGIELTLNYQQDIVHRGGNAFQKRGLNLNDTETYSRLFRTYFDKQRLAELKLSYSPLGNLNLFAAANYQRVEFAKGYGYFPTDPTYFSGDHVDVAETSFEMQWNIRERVMLLGDLRIPQPTVFPKISAKVTKGWSGIAESQLDYLRLNLRISQLIPSMRFGNLNWTLMASQTIGDVPLFLKQNAIGTRHDWNVSVANTFETVFPGEFFHDRQAALFVRYDFPSIKTKAKWNEPQFILHHGIGYGDFANRSEHAQMFKSMDKGLYEAGLIFSGILTQNATSIGLGGFYRYGYYADTDWKKNIVPKISIKFTLN